MLNGWSIESVSEDLKTKNSLLLKGVLFVGSRTKLHDYFQDLRTKGYSVERMDAGGDPTWKVEKQMASVAGPNTSNPIVAILNANGIDPNMRVSRDDGTTRSAFEILEAAVGAALDEIEETEPGQKGED